MFGAALSGQYNKSWGRQKTSKLMDTQKYGLRGLWSQYFQPYFGAADATTGGKAGARAGLGLPGYQGQLAGTYTSPILSRLFSGAAGARTTAPAVGAPQIPGEAMVTSEQAQRGGDVLSGKLIGRNYATGEPQRPGEGMQVAPNYTAGEAPRPGEATMTMPNYGAGVPGQPQTGGPMGGDASQLFSHYDYFANPEERTQARLEEYRKMLAPGREKEDSLMRAKMKSMGLQHSTSMLKAQSDIEQTRQADEALMGMEMLDRYEQLGFEANEAALTRLTEIGKLQNEIANQGLQAQFDEWIRTQPEYNPMIDKMLAYLGLQGKEDTTTHGAGYNIKGSVSYGAGGA